MKLVIAEKNSVARSIAAVLGASQKKKGYLEGNGYWVSWCVGHLVELAVPSEYDEKYTKWQAEDLPILPKDWQYAVIENTKAQFSVLRTLMNDSRVTSIICATDAGREGELIFRLVYSLCGCTKPVERLWISSLEDAAIAEGFRNLRPAKEFDPLYQAALCRAQADWLVGINATRLFSTRYHQLLNIGRVMTPTLALLVEREAQIQAFRSTPFYTVQLDCGSLAAVSERLTERAEAERIAALCDGKEARIIKLEQKERLEQPPRLYDLTSLQRDANRLLGYTAQQTLDYAQSLYEKKLASYPRTDSRYLTSHMENSTRMLVEQTVKVLPLRKNGMSSCNIAQVIDNSKVTDHHALIPTAGIAEQDLQSLPAGERSLLTLLMVRLLCAVGTPCRIHETAVTLECEGVSFSLKGRQITDLGWKAMEKIYRTALKSVPVEETAAQKLPPLNDQMTFLPVKASVQEGKTSPPKSYTEATLLSAMENAGAGETPDDAERKGLGTPATRAGIIEKLVKTGQIERKKGKKSCVLLPTQKGVSLITVLPEELQSPLLTAEWEQKLKQIERGEIEPGAFMEEITDMVRNLVQHGCPVPESSVLFAENSKIVGVCPRCGSMVVERPKGFLCSNRDCRFALWRQKPFFAAKKQELTAAIASTLLKEGWAFVKELYSPKTGKPYDAAIVLDDSGGQYVNFKLEFPQKNNKEVAP